MAATALSAAAVAVGHGSSGWSQTLYTASRTNTKLPLCPGTCPFTYSKLRSGSTYTKPAASKLQAVLVGVGSMS